MMKKTKNLVFLSLTFLLVYSCSDSNPIEDEIVTTRSIALRTVLNQIKVDNNISGGNSSNTTYYDFVYPVSMSYNTGTEVSVSSFSGLASLLSRENENLFLDGISFPFQVSLTSDNSISIVNDESDFNNLNSNYDFTTINEIITAICFDLIYPIDVVTSNGTVTINSENEFLALLSQGGNNYQIDIVFPISIDVNGQITPVQNIYHLFDILNDCVVQTCDCPTDVDPVCVQTANGLVEYDNVCLAECDGYTPADFVDCTMSTSTFDQLLGSCFDMVYPVDILVQGNTTIPINSDSELLSFFDPNQSAFPAFDYPVVATFTIQNSLVDITINSDAEFQTAIDTNCN